MTAIFIVQTIAIPLFVSLCSWLMLRAPLRAVTHELCSKGGVAAENFWPRTFLLLLMFGPLLATLLFSPDGSSSDLWLDVRRTLQYSLIGVIAQTLAMVRIVWSQVRIPAVVVKNAETVTQ